MHRWSTQRKVFGKPLHSQAVIRAKIAGMISRAESEYPARYPVLFFNRITGVQNWLENITYQMCNMVTSLRLIATIRFTELNLNT